METKCLTDNALYSVATHGIAHLTVDTDPQTAALLLAGKINKGKPLATQSPAATIYLIKLPGFPEQTGFREPEPLHRFRQTTVYVLWHAFS